MREIKLISEENNIRIDAYISSKLDDLSRSSVQKLITDENITVNNKKINKNYKLKLNDEIRIFMPPPQVLDVKAEDIALDVVYEDSDVAVINKPQGMVVHPAAGHYTGTLVNALMNKLDDLSSINGVLRPGIVHRLDKNTSGLLIIAKNDSSHNFLSDCLKEHSISRIYYALVEGVVKNDKGIIDAPLGRSEKDRKKRCVTNKNSKEAITNYEVIKRYKRYTLVKLKLETGRTHQIRVHMKYMGYPVVGDDVYGKEDKKFGLKGQLLHYKSIGFVHPTSKEYLEFDSELPKHFTDAIEKIEKLERSNEN